MTFRYLASFNPNGTTYKRPAIPVIFRSGSEEMELTFASILLGWKGFFEKFKITIDESVQKVVLRAVED